MRGSGASSGLKQRELVKRIGEQPSQVQVLPEITIDLNVSLTEPQRMPAPLDYDCPPRTLAEEPSSETPTTEWKRTFAKLKSPTRAFTERRPGIPDYAMLADASKRSGNRRKESLAHYNMGILYDNQRDFLGAAKSYEQFLRLCAKLEDRVAGRAGEALACNQLGVTYHLLKDYRRSIFFHKKHRKYADPRGRIIALCNEGLAWREVGDLGRAEEYHRRALEASLREEDQGGESLAAGHLALDNIKQSSQASEAARRQNAARGGVLVAPLSPSPTKGRKGHTGQHTTSNQEPPASPTGHAGPAGPTRDDAASPTHRPDTRANKGRANMARHMDLCSKMRDPLSMAQSCLQLGKLANERGDYVDALTNMEQAKEYATEAEERSLQREVNVNLGICRGNLRMAELSKALLPVAQSGLAADTIAQAAAELISPRGGYGSGGKV